MLGLRRMCHFFMHPLSMASSYTALLPSISYKASILQHIPELKTVGSSGAAASSSAIAVAPVVSSGAVDAADAAADACEADAAPTASAAVQQVSSPSLDSATPVMAAGAVGPSAEKSTFSVVLKAKGASPYQVIKEVRAITGLGLKEAQALVDGLPHVVKEGASWEEAKAIEAQLTAAGGDVQVE
jgi:large subunit ribosomal protein L7/L12